VLLRQTRHPTALAPSAGRWRVDLPAPPHRPASVGPRWTSPREDSAGEFTWVTALVGVW
jgi:hypothetical protein